MQGSTLDACEIINAQKHDHQSSNSQKKTLYQRYTNFIDSSKTILEHYQSKKFYPGQQKHIHKINSWLEDQSQPNKPLVFKTEPSCGIKTILSNWSKSIGQGTNFKKEKVLTIMHFASSGSNNCNYFYSLYRIIIKLRESLKLKQSVDLLEENIRKFFAYWLDLCSSEVQRQLVIYCAQQIYHKVVIVIEGVDKFIDGETGKQANIAFWLPQCFPKNVKVILTAAKGSQSLEHLQKIKCEIIEVKYDAGIAQAIYNDIISKETILSKQHEKTFLNIFEHLYNKLSSSNNQKSNVYSLLQFYSGVFLPDKSKLQYGQSCSALKQILQKKTNHSQLKSVESIKDLYNFLIELASAESTSLKNKIQSALIYLSLTQKGLTPSELMLLTKMSQKEWTYFETVFSIVMIKYEKIYSIKSTSFIKNIFERDRLRKQDQNYQECIIGYHQKIAKALESTQNSIRKLEEQAYHLFAAKSYFKLKEMISNIENFLLLFNPNNKYELSRYWQKLQEKGFDPVIEYNKAVQGFSMHYHPSDQNIFRIIVQISRFLKEFCDFQTYQTPNFRHPFIQGNMVELQKIGLLKQLSDLEIYIDNSFNTNHDYDINDEFTVDEQIKELKQKYFPKENSQEDLICTATGRKLELTDNLNIINDNSFDFQKLNNTKIKKKSDNIKILSEIEQLNVDVPMNRDKFRSYYLNTLKDFMKKEQNFNQNHDSNKKDIFLDVDETNQPQNASSQSNLVISFNKIRQNYRLRQIKPSLYYYKRWIWIQFPWVCISLNNNYSTTPELRKKIQGDDSDTLQLEYKYTKQALLVAIEAREKKRQMFSKKQDGLQNSKSINKSKSNLFTISKFAGSKVGDSSTNKGKLALKNHTISDLSLHSLTKQLQTRKKKLNIQDVQHIQGQEIFLSQIADNCQQDMKFISLRKQFQTPNIEGMQPNEVLPKLKWVIKEHTNYELNYIKNHIQEKKKKLNKIIYDNKKLGEIYQQLRVKENLSKKNMNEHQNEKYSRKNKVLDDLLKRKEQVITDFCKSLLQKERLKIILKLCSENKTKNEQYLASLNYLLQNLKKMINCQKQNMKDITEELQEFKMQNEKQNILEAEKSKNRKIVEKQAQSYLEQKNKLQKQIENIRSIITQDIKDQKDKLENSLTGHLKHKEQKNQMKEQQKTIKQLQDRYQKVSEEYQNLKSLFQFDQYDFENSSKFKSMLQENQKNKKLKIAYFERKNRLQEVTRDLMRAKEENHKQVQDQLKKMASYNKNNEKKASKPQSNANENRLTILLNNLALKLGCKDKNQIVTCLQDKLSYLRTHHKEKYVEIMGMKAIS